MDVLFSILLLKKCAKFNIDGYVIKSLHMFDLQELIIEFEISEIESYFEHQRKQKMQSRGICEITKVSGNDALRLFGR